MIFLYYNSILVSVIIYKTLIKTRVVCKLTYMNVDNNFEESENKDGVTGTVTNGVTDEGNDNELDNRIEIEIINLVDECVIQQLECHCCLIDENLLPCGLENCDYILCKTCWLRCKNVNNICPCCRRDIENNFCRDDSDLCNESYNADIDSDDDWEAEEASRNNRTIKCGNCRCKCWCGSSLERKLCFNRCLKKYADCLYALAFIGIIIFFLTLGRLIYLLIFCHSYIDSNFSHPHCKNGVSGNDVGIFILTGIIGFFLGALILLASCIFLSFACHDEG